MSSMPARRTLLILNPAAGRGGARVGLFDMVQRLCRRNSTVTVHTTRGGGDARETAARVGGDYQLVVCCGGDGTLSEVTAGLMTVPQEQRPLVGYIPTGSTNDYARSLSLPRNPRKAAELLFEAQPHPIDLGRLGSRYFTYIASLGAFTKVSYTTPQRLKNRLGHMAYLWEGVKDVGDVHPFALEAEWEDGRVAGEFLFGAVTNATSVAGLVRLDPRTVALDDGRLEVLLIRNPRNPLELGDILRGLVRRKYDPRYIYFAHTQRISLRTEQPLSWTLDGEFGGSHTAVTIEAVHRPLRLLAPDTAFV